LKKTASNLCFAGGNFQADVMVIGDVPGRDEDIEGKVFAGQNALLLEKMLAAMGVIRGVSHQLSVAAAGKPHADRSGNSAVPAIFLRAIELWGLGSFFALRPVGAAPVGKERGLCTSRKMV
jgi:DNA polymerase